MKCFLSSTVVGIRNTVLQRLDAGMRFRRIICVCLMCLGSISLCACASESETSDPSTSTLPSQETAAAKTTTLINEEAVSAHPVINAAQDTCQWLVTLLQALEPTQPEDDQERPRIYTPLEWDVSTAYIVGRQGTAGYWGTCGECAIANTLNLVTESTYTEADIVRYVEKYDLLDRETGGMTLSDMMYTYLGLLPLDHMDTYGYFDDEALSIEEMAEKLENGIILNVSVYGEMMREGGHANEGDVHSTHWITLTGTERNQNGSLAGFYLLDSASDITYLSAEDLATYYYGHDGTTIVDPMCVQVYGWEYE